MNCPALLDRYSSFSQAKKCSGIFKASPEMGLYITCAQCPQGLTLSVFQFISFTPLLHRL